MKILFSLPCAVFLLTSMIALADGPFGSVPGEPVKPLPHYTPLNPPRLKPSRAHGSDGVIFNSLKVAAKKGWKSVGGLNCSQAPAKCSLADRHSKSYNDYLIFLAMKGPTKNITSPLIIGSRTFQKQTGRLTCTETVTKTAKPIASYFCSLN